MMLTAVSQEHPAFAEWYQKGGTRRGALRQSIPIDEASIRSTLSRNRKDVGRSVIENLGWTWSAWNGGTGGAELSCGCTFGTTSPGQSNRFLLDLPGEYEAFPVALDRLMELAQRTWEPDDLSIWSRGVVRRLEEPPAG